MVGIGTSPLLPIRSTILLSTRTLSPFAPSQRAFSITHLNALSSASHPARKPVQAKDRPTPGTKHPDGSYLLFHPIYSEQELDNVKVVHRESKTFGDKVARAMCTAARTVFDLATRYPDHRGVKFPPLKKQDVERRVGLPSNLAKQVDRFKEQQANPSTTESAVVNTTKADINQLSKIQDRDEEGMTLAEMRAKRLCFGPDAWLNRIIFLETIAGVPGMVAATCRHLQSLRLMKRDKGWIHTLLQDAENERMHLLTFMHLAKPGTIARAFALLAQGVFYNLFFIFYLFSPRIAHRFVGVLEEEAVLTYSCILEDIKQGRLPEWENVPAPEIAKHYWQLGDQALLVDVIRAVRADEATHRCINHTLASLDYKEDPNPFASRELEAEVRGERYGLERQEALQWAKGEQGKDRSESAEKAA
ncbi:related to alternative oxidase precursor, mitochondrial [Ustilago bromivora]|uniref:Alternative oxidase n=1 Tax=Ustilago bromivora TaxID=307758 RepID=A0A1K0HCW8_9BASI|nr:related to alternative oxidase precursor, mitochondrial [Ustilago bromivora]SYW82757.1 related to alternative oxidase precursor, mitochondrial [Ustilago bromivora]